jgi:hypothetical protein
MLEELGEVHKVRPDHHHIATVPFYVTRFGAAAVCCGLDEN